MAVIKYYDSKRPTYSEITSKVTLLQVTPFHPHGDWLAMSQSRSSSSPFTNAALRLIRTFTASNNVTILAMSLSYFLRRMYISMEVKH